MATKRTLPHPANVHLITLDNVGWNTKLIVPASLLTKFAEVMSLCYIVETEYLQNSCETVAVKGDVEFSSSTLGQSRVLCDSKEQATEFMKFHDASCELMDSTDRVSGRPVVSMDDFMKSLSHQVHDEINYARPS